ncbi:MAG: 3-ketoacyl-ACP reductase, partial [Hoeflea sp.]|nr:3-ketoacyl-ACP reductase [Hoeflea sp.]
MTPLALVTGGQQGIGLGIAKALSDAGFRIALASLP